MQDNSRKILQAFKEDRSCTEFYSRYVSKIFSPYCSRCFIQLGWSANAVTFLMLLLGVLAAPLFLSSSPVAKILGCICLWSINILDTSDGEVARFLQSTSRRGVVLDKIAHFITNTLLFFALWFECYQLSAHECFVFLGIMTVLALTLDEFVQELYLGVSNQGEDNGSRKEKKRSLSASIPGSVRVLFAATSSVVAFYHIYPFLVIIDMLNPVPNVEFVTIQYTWSLLYLSYFSFVSIGKCLLRLAIIWKRM